jgi:heat shock protein HtpX
MATAARPIPLREQIAANRRRASILSLLLGLITIPSLLYFIAVAAMPLVAMSCKGPMRACTEAAVPALVIALPICIWGLEMTSRISAAAMPRRAGASLIPPGEERELRRIVENLCIGSGLPQPELYMIESPIPNVFTAGLDPQRGYLVVTRGLLNELDYRELEAIIARELVQLGNEDARLRTVLASWSLVPELPFRVARAAWASSETGWHFYLMILFGVAVLLFAAAQAFLAVAHVLHEQLPRGWTMEQVDLIQSWVWLAVFVLAPIYSFLVGPVVAKLTRETVSHRREFLADSQAALLTRSPDALVRALQKIGAHAAPWAAVPTDVQPLLAVGPSEPNSVWYRPSHPSLQARISSLVAVGKDLPSESREERYGWVGEVGVVLFTFVAFAVCSFYATRGWAERFWLSTQPHTRGSVIARPTPTTGTEHLLRGHLFIVDATRGVLHATVDLGALVTAAVVSPDGRIVHAIQGPKRIAMVDVQQSAKLFDVEVGEDLQSLAVGGNPDQVFVSDAYGPVSVVEASTQLIRRLATVSRPSRLAVSPDGAIVYTTRSGGVSAIGLGDDEAGSRYELPIEQAIDVAISPDGSQLFIIDATGLQVFTGRASTGRGMPLRGTEEIVASSDGSAVYVLHRQGVWVIDPERLVEVASLSIDFEAYALGGAARAMAISPDGQKVCIARRARDFLSNGQSAAWIVDVASRAVQKVEGTGFPVCLWPGQ